MLSRVHNVVKVHNPSSWSDVKPILGELKADLAIIWNGSEPGCGWFKDICDSHGLKWIIAEQGLFPQKGHFHFDTLGIVSKSSLMGDLSWVSRSLQSQSLKYLQEYTKGMERKPEDFILCPLQIPWDTAVYLSSPFKTMDDYLLRVHEMNPGKRIIATPHPLLSFIGRFDWLEVERDIPTIKMALRASCVVGLTSTVLYETRAIGCPTVALGNCPAAVHKGMDVVLAAVAQQFAYDDLHGMERVMGICLDRL